VNLSGNSLEKRAFCKKNGRDFVGFCGAFTESIDPIQISEVELK